MAGDINLKYILTVQAKDMDEANAKVKAITTSLKAFDTSIKKVPDAANKAGQSFAGLSINAAKLAARAVAVVPIWLAIRGVFTATLGTIGDSTQAFIDMNRELQFLKNELVDIKDVNGALNSVQDQAEKLAQTLGVSSAEAVNSARFFKSAGLTLEESIAGSTIALKASVATGESAKDTTNALISIYKLMGDRIDGATTSQEKFETILGTIFAVMPTQVFTLGEFNDALKNFVGTANTSNLSLEEMTALIAVSATFMQKGARGGTQLTAAFRELRQESEKVQLFLGPKVDIKQLDDFQLLIKFLAQAKVALSQGKLDGAIEDIFGAKGGLVVKSLISGLKDLNIEVDKLNDLDLTEFQQLIEGRVGNALNTLEKQLGRLKILREQIAQRFGLGLLGFNVRETDDLTEALTKINDKLVQIADNASVAGRILGAIVGASSGAAGPLGGLFSIPGILEENDQIRQKAFKNETINKIGSRVLKTPATASSDILTGDGEEVKTIKERTFELEKQLLLTERLAALGFNSLEIEIKKLELLTDQEAIDKQRLEIVKQINKEVLAASEALRSSFQEGLSDLLSGDSSIEDFGKRIGDTIRKGFIDAFAGNVTDQIFKSTGIGEIFGKGIFNIRHAGDGIGGPIKGAFDYGGDIAYDSIVRGFQDGTSGRGPLGPFAPQLPSRSGGGFGGLAGFLNRPGIGTGGLSPVNIENFVAGGKLPATLGQQLGVVGGAATFGISQFQAAGGKQGSLSAPSAAFGALGAGALGLSALGFGGAGTAAATGLGAALGPIGIGLVIGSLLFSSFSKKKQTTVDEQTTETRVGSKIDLTNKQLEVVNRNLIAIDNHLQDVFALPGSTFFSERSDLVDQFSVNSRRGGV